MKKILITLGVLLLASMANAAYMYWQVDDSDGVVSANVYYTREGDSTVYTLKSYYIDELTDELTALSGPANAGATYIIDTEDGVWNDSYSYYIEVTHSDNSKTQIGAPRTGADILSDYNTYVAQAGASGASLSDLQSASLATWHGGTTYSVPEPTSAILMLFGAAMLGLKRKQRRLV